MSGGGGGSSKPKTNTPTTAPMQTIQPGMPGQISTLADQLAAGFGQQPADILAQLQQYYQPMSIPNYAPAAATTPTTPAKTPVTTPTTGKRGSQSEYDAKTGAYNPFHQGGANR